MLQAKLKLSLTINRSVIACAGFCASLAGCGAWIYSKSDDGCLRLDPKRLRGSATTPNGTDGRWLLMEREFNPGNSYSEQELSYLLLTLV